MELRIPVSIVKQSLPIQYTGPCGYNPRDIRISMWESKIFQEIIKDGTAQEVMLEAHHKNSTSCNRKNKQAIKQVKKNNHQPLIVSQNLSLGASQSILPVATALVIKLTVTVKYNLSILSIEITRLHVE